MQIKELQRVPNTQAIIRHLMENPRLIRQYEFNEDLFYEQKDKDIFNSILGITALRDNYEQVTYEDIVSWFNREKDSTFEDFDYLKECTTAHSLSFIAEYKEFMAAKLFREAQKLGLKVDEVIDNLNDTPFSSINTVDWLSDKIKSINNIQDKYSGNIEKVGICDAEDLPVDIEEEENDWLVEGLFKENSFNSITAEEKIGKTQLVNQLATAVTNGLDFFHFPCKKGDVIVVDFELTEKEIKKRAIDCKLKFYQDASLKTFKTFPVAMAFTRHTLDWVINQVEEYCINNPNVKLIVFDCLFRFIRGDLNKVQDVEKVLSQLKVLQKYACVCYVHHHSGKNKDSGVSAFNYGSGSTVLGWMPDEVMTMKMHTDKDDEKRVDIAVKGRHVGDTVRFWGEKDPDMGWYFREIDNPNNDKKSDDRQGLGINKARKNFPEVCDIIDANDGQPVEFKALASTGYAYKDDKYRWYLKSAISNSGVFDIDKKNKTIGYKISSDLKK